MTSEQDELHFGAFTKDAFSSSQDVGWWDMGVPKGSDLRDGGYPDGIFGWSGLDDYSLECQFTEKMFTELNFQKNSSEIKVKYLPMSFEIFFIN